MKSTFKIKREETVECAFMLHDLTSYLTVLTIMRDDEKLCKILEITEEDKQKAKDRYNKKVLGYREWWRMIADKYEIPQPDKRHFLDIDFTANMISWKEVEEN